MTVSNVKRACMFAFTFETDMWARREAPRPRKSSFAEQNEICAATWTTHYDMKVIRARHFYINEQTYQGETNLSRGNKHI